MYSQQTVTKFFQLKQQLRSVKKDSRSVNDYVLEIKTIGHALAAIGEPLGDKDLLLAILNGLDHQYETIVSLITYQMDEIKIEKVQYLLLMHEQCLATKNQSVLSSISSNVASSMNVKVASYRSRSGDMFANNRGSFAPRGDGYVNKGSRGHGGRSGGRHIYCQLCGKTGHLVDRCYHRFDRNF